MGSKVACLQERSEEGGDDKVPPPAAHAGPYPWGLPWWVGGTLGGPGRGTRSHEPEEFGLGDLQVRATSGCVSGVVLLLCRPPSTPEPRDQSLSVVQPAQLFVSVAAASAALIGSVSEPGPRQLQSTAAPAQGRQPQQSRAYHSSRVRVKALRSLCAAQLAATDVVGAQPLPESDPRGKVPGDGTVPGVPYAMYRAQRLEKGRAGLESAGARPQLGCALRSLKASSGDGTVPGVPYAMYRAQRLEKGRAGLEAAGVHPLPPCALVLQALDSIPQVIALCHASLTPCTECSTSRRSTQGQSLRVRLVQCIKRRSGPASFAGSLLCTLRALCRQPCSASRVTKPCRGSTLGLPHLPSVHAA